MGVLDKDRVSRLLSVHLSVMLSVWYRHHLHWNAYDIDIILLILITSTKWRWQFFGRYLQFYQPMVLNSLVVSLVPVAILSLQVDLLSSKSTMQTIYYHFIRASWTRTGRVCWRTSVSPRRGSPSLAPSLSPSIWSSRCQSVVEFKTIREKVN